jgi:AcrR family transcriptional regulator
MAEQGVARTMGRPRSLTRERVLDAALGLLAARGLDALSIRNLAVELGVTPGTVYAYVDSKDDLLAAMADRLIEGIDVSDGEPEPTWDDELRRLLSAYYGLLVRYPALLNPALAITRAVPSAARLAERILLLIGRAGFDEGTADQRATMLTSFVLGSALNTVWRRTLDRTPGLDWNAYAAQQTPRLRRALLAGKNVDLDATFATGLDAMVAGLAPRVRSPRRRRRR